MPRRILGRPIGNRVPSAGIGHYPAHARPLRARHVYTLPSFTARTFHGSARRGVSNNSRRFAPDAAAYVWVPTAGALATPQGPVALRDTFSLAPGAKGVRRRTVITTTTLEEGRVISMADRRARGVVEEAIKAVRQRVRLKIQEANRAIAQLAILKEEGRAGAAHTAFWGAMDAGNYVVAAYVAKWLRTQEVRIAEAPPAPNQQSPLVWLQLAIAKATGARDFSFAAVSAWELAEEGLQADAGLRTILATACTAEDTTAITLITTMMDLLRLPHE